MYQHFDKMLREFGIKGKDLANVTGFSMTHISQFRHGKTNPSCDSLERFLNGADQIKPGAKRYFCELLAGREIQPVVEVLEHLDDAQLARLLFKAADRLENRKSEPPQGKSALPQELLSA
jgi:transcriptional regulator with XRE-family HTH domain